MDDPLPLPIHPARRRPLPAWLQEPLLHFLVLGGILFAVDHFAFGRQDDPRTIVVDASVDQEAAKLFSDARGRESNPAELAALRQRWIDNEVLYREGLAQRVDQGDKTIRERVIFKSLMAIEAGLKLQPLDEQGLRGWFEANRIRYDEPARIDFQEAVLAGGEATDTAARALADALNAGAPALDASARAGLRVFKGRPRDNLVQGYGDDFTKALEQSPVGQWQALRSRDGLRVVRLQAVAAPRGADFDTLQGVVRQDWVDSAMAQKRTDAVRALAKKYNVKIVADAGR